MTDNTTIGFGLANFSFLFLWLAKLNAFNHYTVLYFNIMGLLHLFYFSVIGKPSAVEYYKLSMVL